jgi:hypothetical protein
MANVQERDVAIAERDGCPVGSQAQHEAHLIAGSHPTVADALEKALQAAGEGKNVEPLLFDIGATVLGLLLGYAVMVFARLQVGILAIALY